MVKNKKYSELIQTLGLRVQFFRKQNNFTQSALAEKISKTEDTISNIERGIGSSKIETLFSICEVLNISISDLFDFPISNHKTKSYSRHLRKIIDILEKQGEQTMISMIKIIEEIFRIR